MSQLTFQVEKAYKQYIKDTVKLFDASGPDAMDFASHLYHYESRIAEITPVDHVLNDPLASNVKITIGKLSLISTNVSLLIALIKGGLVSDNSCLAADPLVRAPSSDVSRQ